jgi:hypothetical protein
VRKGLSQRETIIVPCNTGPAKYVKQISLDLKDVESSTIVVGISTFHFNH